MARRARPGEDAGVPTGTARNAALRLLGRRDYAAAELTTRLHEKRYPAEEVERAVAELIADGSVDDRRLAFAYVRSACAIKGRGRLRIKRELEARGISAALAAEATRELDADDERAAITRVIGRKRGTARLDRAGRQRLFAQLLRRGFSADLIIRSLDFDPSDE